jgi:hypothetical protein
MFINSYRILGPDFAKMNKVFESEPTQQKQDFFLYIIPLTLLDQWIDKRRNLFLPFLCCIKPSKVTSPSIYSIA